MKKVTYKSLVTMLAAGLVVCTGMGLAKIVPATAYPYSHDLFTCVQAYAEGNAVVPAESGIADARRGLHISASQSGATASFNGSMTGQFDIEFMPYSSVTYGGSEYETDLYSNTYQDINAMSLVFTDAKDESNSFRVRLTGGADGNSVTVNASVEAKGERAGVYYYQDNPAYGSTSGYNANNVYTFLYGCSFSNVAVAAGRYASANVRPVRIVFDPAEMKVYGCHYGYFTSSPEYRLIWDFSKASLDGRDLGFTLDGFDEYTVSLVFDDVRTGTTGNIVVYSVNGQTLASTVLQNDAGPNCYLREAGKAAVGEYYTLPTPIAYDVCSGKLPFSGRVKVLDPSGNACVIENATAGTDGFYTFAEGARVLCSKFGTYTLVYQATDGDFYGEEYSFALYVEDRPDAAFFGGLTRIYYGIGETLNIPAAGWTVNGKNVNAQYTVYDPSNQPLSSPYALREEGRYTVVYTAQAEGKPFSEEVYLYALSASDGLFTGSNGATVAFGASGLHEDLNGLIAEYTVNNSTLTYKTPVKISDKTKGDTLIALMAIPEKFGSANFGQISIKLQDSANADNAVTVLIGSNGLDTSVVRAASGSQTLSGLNNSGVIESFSGGGTVVLHSFSGVARYRDIREQLIDLRFDAQGNRIYIGEKLVCDLDNSEHFSQIWDGFTSDTVILSVSMREITAQRGKLLIAKVDGNAFVDGYSCPYAAPEIVATFEEDEIPKALVGSPYQLLPVTVKDAHGDKVTLQAEVFDIAGNAVTIANQAFTPTKEGDYTIRYTAVNAMGNRSTRSFTVSAATELEPLSVTAESISSSFYVGEVITLFKEKVSGGAGGYTVTITAKGNTTATSYPVSEYKLRVLVADTYTVTYLVTDYLGNTQRYEFTMTVSSKDAPVFEEVPAGMPAVFISGIEATLPVIGATDYDDGGKSAPVTVTVSVDGGAPVPVGKDMKFTAEIKAARARALVTYTAAGKYGSESLTFEIPVVNLRNDNGELDLTRYFLTKNIDRVESHDEYVSFALQSGAEITFIKPVYAHNFELMFDVPVTANNVDNITITLTDAADPTKQVAFEVLRGRFEESFTNVLVNGSQPLTIVGNFYDAIRQMRIAYDNNNFSVKDATGLTVGKIKNYLDGRLFRGFSDNVEFSLRFGNVNGVAQFNLYKVGNQQFLENDDDYTRPVVILEKELQRSLEKGGVLTVPRAKAFDVLSFRTTITVSVSKTDGTMLLSDASCEETHTVTLVEYGEYNVIYRAVDENGNVNPYLFAVNVRDNVAPVIDVDLAERTVWAGDSFEIKQANVTDDVEIEKFYIFVIDPTNKMNDVTNEKSFQTSRKGIYAVRYVAVDTSGNYTIVDVTVKAAEVKA